MKRFRAFVLISISVTIIALAALLGTSYYYTVCARRVVEAFYDLVESEFARAVNSKIITVSFDALPKCGADEIIVVQPYASGNDLAACLLGKSPKFISKLERHAWYGLVDVHMCW